MPPETTIELIIDAPLYVIKKACSREEQTEDLIKRLVEQDYGGCKWLTDMAIQWFPAE